MSTVAPPRILVLALALLALALAGCGESDEEKFASEVNEICTESEDDVQGTEDPDTLVAAIDEVIDDLKAVDPPESKKDDYDAWVAIQEKVGEEFKAAVRANDRQRLDAIDDDAGDEQARELGLDDCTS